MKKYNKYWLALVAVFAMGAANADPIEIALTGTVDIFSSGFGLNGGDPFNVVVLVDSTVLDLTTGFNTFDTLTGLMDVTFDFNGTIYSLSDAEPSFLPFSPYITIFLGSLLDLNYFSADFLVGAFGNFVTALDLETFAQLSASLVVTSITEVAVPEPGTLALFGLGLLGMLASRRRKLAKS